MKKRNIKSILPLLIAGLLIFLAPLSVVYGQESKKPKKILCVEAYDRLNTVPDTFLIDVRTRAEYQYTGHPINAYLFPYMFFTAKLAKTDDKYEYQLSQKNKDFIEEIGKIFKKTDHLIIISRDGTRSALAAQELVDAGYEKVYDVEDGFEGPEFPNFEDANKNKYYRQLARQNKVQGFQHRRRYGWQWWGLPWTYNIDPKYMYPPDLPKTSTVQ
ncbi:rhodanese-like domain-containing protein [Thermodesulfobacteriota bacterium]